jgi:hypothetical protein
MTQHAMLRPRGRVRTARFNQLTPPQSFESELDGTFRKTGFFRDCAQAGADRTPSLALCGVVETQIHEKRRRLAIVADQVAHQDVENVIVDRNGVAKARHGRNYGYTD